MNKKTNSQVFDSAAREHIPDHVDLAPQIMAHIQKGKGVSMNPKLKLFATVLTVIVTFALVFASGPTVVHALQALFGYIPGVGTVAPGGFRTLSEPVSQTKDGVTVTIQKGTIDANRTILTMTVTGSTAVKREMCGLEVSTDPYLRLPDGTSLKTSTWTGTGPTRYDMRYYFPALPANVDDATIEIPCLLHTPSPVDWEIPLHFGPANGPEPLAVIDVDAATPGAQTAAQSPYNISMALERVIPLDDGYILTGNLKWDNGNDALDNITGVWPSAVHVTDANGQELTAEWVAADAPDPDTQTAEKVSWNYKISGKDHAWPLTLSFANLEINWISNTGNYATFTIDLGENPQLGQTWTLNKDLRNYQDPNLTVHFNTATMVTDPYSGNLGVLFDAQSGPDMLNIEMEDVNVNGGYVPMRSDNVPAGHIGTGYALTKSNLSGERVFSIVTVDLLVHGNWQVTWQP